MHKNKIIHQFTAVALLLIFVLGNSPQQWLHDLFANHIDYKNGIVAPTQTTNLYQSSSHCQTDHFVVESSFTNDAQAIVINSSVSYLHFKNVLYYFHTVNHHYQPALRGPPVFS